MASARDVNGDGYADLIIGAPEQDMGAGDSGTAFVYHGSAAGVSTTPTLTFTNPIPQASANFGYSVGR